MKELSFLAKTYFFGVYMAGIMTMAWHLLMGEFNHPWMLIVLCFIASLALLFKVDGATNRSHYKLRLHN
jgi:hypothetical protein